MSQMLIKCLKSEILRILLTLRNSNSLQLSIVLLKESKVVWRGVTQKKKKIQKIGDI